MAVATRQSGCVRVILFSLGLALTASSLVSHVTGDTGNSKINSLKEHALVIVETHELVNSTGPGNNVVKVNTRSKRNSDLGSESDVPDTDEETKLPDIYSFRIQSDIRYRYSQTQVTSRVANRDPDNSHEVTFRIVLPETAFISKFVMEIDEKKYEAYVKEKEEAKKIYHNARDKGHSAGLVEIHTRNSNIFNVNVNIKAKSKVNFKLTYEELLKRRLGRYEQSINISPEQMNNVHDFQVVVNIEESQNITLLRVPQLRNDIEAPRSEDGDNPDGVIVRPSGNRARVTWKSAPKDQTALAEQGLTGKFVVQYDISRELDSGEVLVMNGYFVHFFAPANLAPLKKHVVFILDVSGSMSGKKMEQLKEAMSQILTDLSPDDFFNIIIFSTDVTLWDPVGTGSSSIRSKKQPLRATSKNIQKARAYISTLEATGGTNIHDAVIEAIALTSLIKKEQREANQIVEPARARRHHRHNNNINNNNNNESVGADTVLPVGAESLIIFLTDGEPTNGVTDPRKIESAIQTANKNDSIPIFSLAFGEGADFGFVRKISLQNNGFARKIYEASDAAIQLRGFYNEIASPLLSDVKFNYTSPEFSISDLTVTRFATVFEGSEIAVCGTLTPTTKGGPEFPPLELQEESLSLPVGIDADVDVNATTTPTEFQRTDKYNFYVVVDAHGRNGSVKFVDPEMFSSAIPWGISWDSTLRPVAPRPRKTQEDTFLEKMWAYLTIKQLINRDLAGNEISTDSAVEPGSERTVKETPKAQALRLALKYGFVTPLTSLVVLKPEETAESEGILTEAEQRGRNKNYMQTRYAAGTVVNHNHDWMSSSSGSFNSLRCSLLVFGFIPIFVFIYNHN